MPGFDFKRLKRLTIIYRVVQALLIALLVFMALNFQNLFTVVGRPERFMTSILVALVIQLLLVYPIYKLARRDAAVEIEASQMGLSTDQLMALRKKRLYGDMLKFCVLAFFVTFVALAPDIRKTTGAPLILAATIFSFLLTCLTYFQSFNYCARKRIKQP